MKKLLKNTVLLLGSAAFILSCKQSDQLGPDFVTVSEDFDPSSVTITSGDQLTPALNFLPEIDANWGQDASYTVTVTGLESGAMKEFSGISSSFKEKWNGQSSNIYFFRVNEKATVSLKLAGYDSIFVSTDTILITGLFSFNRKTINDVYYYVVDGFEGNAENPLNQVSPDARDNDVDFGITSNLSVEGNSSLRLTGVDANNNGWSGDRYQSYLGVLLKGNVNNLPIDSGIDPADLYVNMFIYGTGAPSTTVEIKLSEIDGGDTLLTRKQISDWIADDVNNESPINAADNDAWLYDVLVTWKGWKLVSIPYSRFRAANDPNNGGGGDRIKESFRISGVTVSLLSFPRTGQKTEAYVDYITITTGGRANYN